MTYVNVPMRGPSGRRGFRGLGASDPGVVAIQNQINTVLVANGQDAITVDGIAGPGTCAAALQSADYDGGTILNAVLASNMCDSSGNPVASAPKKVVVSSSTSKSVVPSSSSGTILGMPTTTVIMVGLGVVALYTFMGSGTKKGSK